MLNTENSMKMDTPKQQKKASPEMQPRYGIKHLIQ